MSGELQVTVRSAQVTLTARNLTRITFDIEQYYENPALDVYAWGRPLRLQIFLQF